MSWTNVCGTTCKLIIPISEGLYFIGNYFHCEKVENHQHCGKSNWFRVLQTNNINTFLNDQRKLLHFNIVHFFN